MQVARERVQRPDDGVKNRLAPAIANEPVVRKRYPHNQLSAVGVFMFAGKSLWVRWSMSQTTPPRVNENNRFGLDYRQEAARLGPPVTAIVDVHTHIHGVGASRVYDEARRLFGVRLSYTMTQHQEWKVVRDTLGGDDSIRFIAFPSFRDPDKSRLHREGFLQIIERARVEVGARMLKLWSSPKLRELVPDGATDVWEIDSPWRVKACELGESLGMMFMVHVADPDLWFRHKYTDVAKYGTKAGQYIGLERMLDRFTAPWIAAHMGGWPEDLRFLDGLLARHPNLHLDTSATKWIARELSRHPASEVVAFLEKWRGRVLFGSDIVAMDDHLSTSKAGTSVKSDQSSSPEGAFDLYASRYFVLRTMFETAYDGESSIADSDLGMENAPANTMHALRLRGLNLGATEAGRSLLKSIYADASGVVDRWWKS